MKREEEASASIHFLMLHMSDTMPGAGSSEMNYACSPAPSIPGMSAERKLLERENAP